MGRCFSRPHGGGGPNHSPPLSSSQMPSQQHQQQHFSSIHGSNNIGGGAAAESHLFQSLANQRRIAQMNVYKDDSSSLARKMTPMGSMYYGGMPIPQNSTMSSLDSRGQHSLSSQKVIALYGYESRVDGDISFKKDDIMVILEETNSDWWYVRHAKNGLGFVPRNFIAPLDSLEREEWFSGKITRSMAEKLVSAPNLPRGTFLIRKRDHENEYALTINDAENARLYGQNTKHYRIKPLDNLDGYYITTKKIFPTIKDLVSFYSEESAGLCCKLTYAAPKLAPQRTDLSSDTKNNWEIPRTELQMIEKIGTGNFGAVYAGLWRGKVEVAIKTLKPGTMSPEAFLKEAQIMKQCQHPKLVRLYAVCTREEPYLIVTEFMKNGSLLDYLKKPENHLSHKALVDMCSQIAHGMTFLEERKLVHRDLAARNILVGDKISGIPEVKVADFGLARIMEEEVYEAAMGAKFPIKWTAIEAATYGNFSVKSDVWSYGILLYEIFTRSAPYQGMSNKQVIDEVERGYRLPKPSEIEDAIYERMLQCWHKDPEKRPCFAFLHSFFDDYTVSSQPSYVPSSIDDPCFGGYRR